MSEHASGSPLQALLRVADHAFLSVVGYPPFRPRLPSIPWSDRQAPVCPFTPEAATPHFVPETRFLAPKKSRIYKTRPTLVTSWSPAILSKSSYRTVNKRITKKSKIVGTNTTYLSNAVNDYFGCNLKSLINWYRVQYAKMMLDKRIYRLKDIPYICGFSSKSTFYVAFKRCEGMTPNQYLSAHKEDSETSNNNDNNNILKPLNLKF